MALAAWALGAALLLVPRVRGRWSRRGVAAPGTGSARATGTASVAARAQRVSDRAPRRRGPRPAQQHRRRPRARPASSSRWASPFTPTRGLVRRRPGRDRRTSRSSSCSCCAWRAAFTAARDRGRLRPVLALSVARASRSPPSTRSSARPTSRSWRCSSRPSSRSCSSACSPACRSRGRPARARGARGRRNVLAGSSRASASFAVIWATLSRTSPATGDAAEQIARTPRRARRRRRDGDPRRLPRARHDGRDHRPGRRDRRRREPAAAGRSW